MLADDSNTDCCLIPPAKDPEDCEVVVEYNYIVTITILKPQNIDKVVRNFNGNDDDLT